VYKNKLDRKSLTVHHIQRRLLEWGYTDAYSDRDGYYADGTVASVAKFQEDHKLTRTDGHMDCETMNAIFENDHNVTVVCA
jgi:peptidoglycan hydrolase-like protein with peptidoglycan-binding domain